MGHDQNQTRCHCHNRHRDHHSGDRDVYGIYPQALAVIAQQGDCRDLLRAGELKDELGETDEDSCMPTKNSAAARTRRTSTASG